MSNPQDISPAGLVPIVAGFVSFLGTKFWVVVADIGAIDPQAWWIPLLAAAIGGTCASIPGALKYGRDIYLARTERLFLRKRLSEREQEVSALKEQLASKGKP